MRLFIAPRVRNAKSRICLKKIDRPGGFTEDQSQSLDLAYSNYEATVRRPPTYTRVRIGLSRFDVNKHL